MSVIIKGLDNGYLYTKDNNRRIFKSAYTKDIMATSGSALIHIDDIGYCVGSGNTTVDIDKTDQEINKVCTLTNLAMSGNNEYYLVVGLPIGQYKLQREKFAKMIMGYNDCEVIYKDTPMDIKIKDVFVFPQGAGAVLSLNEIHGDCIVFDFGGLTIDIGYIEWVNGNPSIQKFDTWYKGSQKLYSQIIHQVNNKYNLTYEIDYAEKILVNGLLIDGVKQDLNFLQPVLNQYLEPILTSFQLNYPAKSTPIYLCGGSANIFHDVFKKRFPAVTLMPDSQFANAMGYYKIGIQKYGKYLQQVNINNCIRR